MTKLRSTARLEAVAPQLHALPSPRRVLQRGLLGLGLGAGLTWLAVAWSDGVLGFVSLMLVLGSLAWISLGLVRHFAARLRRRA
jgi:hypothetical protein